MPEHVVVIPKRFSDPTPLQRKLAWAGIVLIVLIFLVASVWPSSSHPSVVAAPVTTTVHERVHNMQEVAYEQWVANPSAHERWCNVYLADPIAGSHQLDMLSADSADLVAIEAEMAFILSQDC